MQVQRKKYLDSLCKEGTKYASIDLYLGSRFKGRTTLKGLSSSQSKGLFKVFLLLLELT